MRLPGGDGAGLEDQATRGPALRGDKWDLGGLPRRGKWAKSQRRGTFPTGYFTGGRVWIPCAARAGDGSFHQGAAHRGLRALTVYSTHSTENSEEPAEGFLAMFGAMRFWPGAQLR